MPKKFSTKTPTLPSFPWWILSTWLKVQGAKKWLTFSKMGLTLLGLAIWFDLDGDEMDRRKVFGGGWESEWWTYWLRSLVGICYMEHHVQTPSCHRSIRSGVPITGKGDLLGFQENGRRATEQLEGYNNQGFWFFSCAQTHHVQNQKKWKHVILETISRREHFGNLPLPSLQSHETTTSQTWSFHCLFSHNPLALQKSPPSSDVTKMVTVLLSDRHSQVCFKLLHGNTYAIKWCKQTEINT